MVVYILAAFLAAAVLYILTGSVLLNRVVSRSVARLAGDAKEEGPGRQFSYTELEGLPEPVQRYFRHVLPEGREYIRFARLKQEAEMKLAEGQKWVPVKAEQYFATGRPGFVWHARARPFPLFWFEGRDMYYRGEGSMFFKLYSAVKVADYAGENIAKGALVRYLTEAVWLPTALLPESGKVEWEPLDDSRARLVFHDGGFTVAAVCHFNRQGEMTGMETMDRPKFDEKEPVKFTTRYSDYREVGGIKIPLEGACEWNYEDRDYQYFRGRIIEIEYNKDAYRDLENSRS